MKKSTTASTGISLGAAIAVAISWSMYHSVLWVIIHGILHLLGYKDKGKKEKEIMREKEDFYLSLQT